MNLESYLKRIQIFHPPETTGSFLKKIQLQHLLHIPFENLDIIQNKPLSLAIPDLYRKIIREKRGGVCYELNGLFNTFLNRLGFHAHLIAATVKQGDHWGVENSHATILVTLGAKKYLVDVGFGGKSPRIPIPMTEEIVQDAEGDYRVRRYQKKIDVFVLERKEGTDWNQLYRFTTNKWDLMDFTTFCDQIQYSPGSPFNKGYFLMKVTENGRKTLRGDSLSIVEKEKKVKQVVSPDQLEEVVQTFFN